MWFYVYQSDIAYIVMTFIVIRGANANHFKHTSCYNNGISH